MAAIDDNARAALKISRGVVRKQRAETNRRRRGIMPLGRLHGDLQRGKPLKFVAIGDSTTDGNTIPGRTGNNPGNVDWDADPGAVSAWPNQLEGLLINMWGIRTTSNLFVHNAGASGKTMNWFLQNYITRIIENKFYRTPDYAFIQLGLNDVEEMLNQDKTNAYLADARRLLTEFMRRGIIPILLTCDPSGGQGGYYGTYASSTPRDARVVEFMLNRYMEMLADEVGCMFMDINILMKDLMNHGFGGPSLNGQVGPRPRAYELWDTTMGTPFLHGPVLWHGMKAQAIALLMSPHVIRVKPGERRHITTRFAETTQKPDNLSAFAWTLRNNAQGGAEVMSNTDAQLDTTVLTAWVWCDGNDFSSIYRGNDGEGINSGSAVSTMPKIRRTSMWNNDTESISSPVFGWSHQGSPGGSSYPNSRKTDQPSVVQRLQPGLNKLSYVTGTNTAERYLGYFDIYPAQLRPVSDALNGLGRLALRCTTVAGKRSILAPEAVDLSNVLAMRREDEQHILYSGNLFSLTGLILCHNPRYNQDTPSEAQPGDRTGMMLYRNGNVLELRHMHTESGGTATGNSLSLTNTDGGVVITSTTMPNTADLQNLRIRLVTTGLTWTIEVYNGWDIDWVAATPFFKAVLTASSGGPIIPAMCGVVGGLWFAGSGASVKHATIERLIIERTPLI